METRRFWPEVAAGSGLGLLVGVLLGLSMAHVVGEVVGALAAILASFLGLSQLGNISGVDRSARIAAFGFTCVAALIAGIAIRTHDLASPAIKSQIRQFTDAHYSDEDARALVAFKLFGIVPQGREVVSVPGASSTSSILFSNPSSSECSNLRGDRFADTAVRVEAMRKAGGAWKEFVTSLPPAAQSQSVIEAGYKLACE